MDQVQISASDRAGNSLDDVTLARVLGDSDPHLVVVRPAKGTPKAEVEITHADSSSETTSESIFRGTVNITFKINDHWFPLYRALNKDADVSNLLELHYSHAKVKNDEVEIDLDLQKFERDGGNTWVYTDINLPQSGYGDKPLEALYEVSWAYPSLLPSEKSSKGTETFWVDYTSPNITEVAIADLENFPIIETLREGHIRYDDYAGEPLLLSRQGDSIRYEVTLQDVFSADHPAFERTHENHSPVGTSGLDEVSIKVNIPEPTDLHGQSLGDSVRDRPKVTDDGKFHIELSAEGLYDLSKVTISARDKAGNNLDKASLYDALQRPDEDSEAVALPEHKFVVINGAESSPSADLTVKSAKGEPVAKDDSMFRGDVAISFTIKDRWFPLYSALKDQGDLNKDHLSLTRRYDYTDDDAQYNYPDEDEVGKAIKLPLDAAHFAPGKNNTWVYTDIALPEAEYSDKPLEARYEFEWNYPGLNPLPDSSTGSETFWIDYTTPVISEARATMKDSFWIVDKLPQEHIKNKNYSGESLLVSPQGDTVTYRLKVQDLFPKGHSAHGRSPGKDHSHIGISGLTETSVKFNVPQRTDLQGEQLGKSEVVSPEVGKDGSFIIELSGEGLYDLTKVTVSASDRAGNELGSISLYQALLSDKTPHHKYVVINRDESPTEADLTITKAKGVPSSKDDSYYYRGDIATELTVTDRWFPIYLAHRDQLDGLVTLRHDASPGTSGKSTRTNAKLNPSKFVATDDDQWVYRDIALPRAPGSSQPLEAEYDVSWNYSGLNTKRDHADTSGHHEFVVDYTGPKLGKLGFSDLSNIQGDWIVAGAAYKVTLNGVSDSVAGVDADSVGFHRFEDNDWNESVSRIGFDKGVSDLEEHPMPSPAFSGSTDYAGKISFDLTGNSQRLMLNRTVIGLTDKAGNPVDTGLLNRYEPTQLELRPNKDDIPEGPKGIVIASATPSLQVAYDHDNVRNGHYYKDERTATITVSDANFDLLKELDGFATVMTAAVDDSERTVTAEDFSNPSKDRQTWVANFEFDTDGDWEIDAQATTISDKKSESFTDSWTLDTLDPMISADLNPEMGEAGQYFNTVRTATLTIDERNFSPNDTSVAVSAETPDGTSVPAPGGSGWREVDEYKWSQTITFADELVYEISIDTMDLAGNTTDTYEVPEFIVDLTAPEVEITQVEDSTAYAGIVAPQVEVSDIYLPPGQVQYTLEGFNQGTVDSSTHFVTEDFDETTWSAVWEDFPREIEVDDIYILSVTATDMAGNTTSDAVTFSVNRFGSTYMFSDGTKNLRGQYLKEPVDVEVTEINVSGLNPDLTEVSVAENDVVKRLDNDEFEREDASVAGGWQATQYTLPAQLFDASAYFRIMLTSVDEAGNLSQNIMENKAPDRKSSADVKFAVDQIAPDVVVSDVESSGVYYSPVKNLIPDAKDNLALESVTMIVDGKTVLEASGSEALTEILAYELPADAQEHTIVVSATDKAGNVSKATYANVMVAANFWHYLASQPLLATALVAGGLILLAALVIGTIAFVRRRRRLAYRRNPFGL